MNSSETKDVSLEFEGVNKESLCKRSQGIFYEAFRDSKGGDNPLSENGPVHCEVVNGKLYDFPLTIEDHNKFAEHVSSYLDKKNTASWSTLNVAVNAYAYSPIPERPNVSHFPNMQNFDFYHLETDTILNITDDMRSRLTAANGITFQVKEKLCIAVNIGRDAFAYMPINCVDFRGDITTFCSFEKKIQVRLSGICSKSPTDTEYVLAKPKFHEEYEDGEKWGHHWREGTFLGKNFVHFLSLLSV